MKIHLFLTIFLIIKLCIAEDTGILQGKVTDKYGNGLKDYISLRIKSSVGSFYKQELDSNGFYYLKVPCGTYQIIAGSREFNPVQIDNVRICKDSISTIDIVVPYPPPFGFRQNKYDFLTLYPNEPLFNLDTLNSNNINTKSSEGITPLLSLFYENIDNKNPQINLQFMNYIEKCQNLGADPNIQSNLGFSPIMKACEFGLLDIAKVLLENETNPNLENYQGQTALHFAVRSGNFKVVELLLKSKAKTTIKDKTGRKPIFYAKSSDIIIFLKDKSYLSDEEKYFLAVLENDIAELEKCLKKY